MGRRTALVSGAGRGIGRAVAVDLARRGIDVAIFARTPDEIHAAASEVEGAGGRVVADAVDVTDGPRVVEFVERTVRELGRLDIVVNNAGGTADRDQPITASTPERWWSVVEVNLYGTYVVSRACLDHLGPGSSIVNIGSGVGHEPPRSGMSSYAVAKAGVRMLTRSLAVELWDRSIAVNEVIPGPVANGLDPEAMLAEMAGTPPPRAAGERWKHPDRVAELVWWLVDRGPDGPTGQTFSLARRPL